MLTEFLHQRTVFGIRDGDTFDIVLQKIGDKPCEIGENQLDSKVLTVTCPATWEIQFFDDEVYSIIFWNAWNFGLHLKIESEEQVVSRLARYGLGVLRRRKPDDLHIHLDLTDGMAITLRREHQTFKRDDGLFQIGYLGRNFPF